MDMNEYIRRGRRRLEKAKNSWTEDADQRQNKSNVAKRKQGKNKQVMEEVTENADWEIGNENNESPVFKSEKSKKDLKIEYKKDLSHVLKSDKKLEDMEIENEKDTGRVLERSENKDDWEIEYEKETSYILDSKDLDKIKHQKDTNDVVDRKDTTVSLQMQIWDLTEQVNSLKNENSVFLNEQKKYDKSLEELKEENSSLLNARKGFQDKIAGYTKQLEEADSKLKQHEKWQASLNQEIDILRDDKQTLLNYQNGYLYTISENQKQLKEYEKRLSEKMVENDKQKAFPVQENQFLKNERTSILQENLSLKVDNKDLKYEIKSLRQELYERKKQEGIGADDIQSLKEEIKFLHKEKDEFLNERIEWEHTIAEYEDVISQYEKRLDEFSETLIESGKEIQSIKQEKACVRKQLQEFEKKLNEEFRIQEEWAVACYSTRIDLEATITDLTSKLQSANRSWNEEKYELSAALEKIEKLNEDLKHQNNNIEEFSKVSNSLREALQAENAQKLEELSKEIGKKNDEIEVLKKEVAEKENRIDILVNEKISQSILARKLQTGVIDIRGGLNDNDIQLKEKLAQQKQFFDKEIEELRIRNTYLLNSIKQAAMKYNEVGAKIFSKSSGVIGLSGKINKLYDTLVGSKSELHETAAELNEVIKKRKRLGESHYGQERKKS